MYSAKIAADYQPDSSNKKRTPGDSDSDGEDADPDAGRSSLTIAAVADSARRPNPRSATDRGPRSFGGCWVFNPR